LAASVRTASEEWHISLGAAARDVRLRARRRPSHGRCGHDTSSDELRRRGLDIVRLDFLYRASGGRAPDRMPLLQACMKA
jgi:hypothetical protein